MYMLDLKCMKIEPKQECCENATKVLQEMEHKRRSLM